MRTKEELTPILDAALKKCVSLSFLKKYMLKTAKELNTNDNTLVVDHLYEKY